MRRAESDKADGIALTGEVSHLVASESTLSYRAKQTAPQTSERPGACQQCGYSESSLPSWWSFLRQLRASLAKYGGTPSSSQCR